ncbi:MAG: UvrD-helicase domain-containing protein [Microthrixaceae bacterium]|nr:UvrD-helicase domain-containing protein [Microthrixaceae bacterium]
MTVPLDLAGPLPRGRLSVAASAGTGKTHALSTLAARYVVEADIPVHKLLVVTFTRAAAAELKDRVRARLVELATALETAADDPGWMPDDPVLARVCADDHASRLRRARAALTEFDSATISTIHGFAQQVLGTLGSAVRTDPDAVLVDDTAALVTQVATDLLVAEATRGTEGLPSLEELTRATHLALTNHASRLHPCPGAPEAGRDDEATVSALRLRGLVERVIETIRHRRTAAGTLSFDDLLLHLRDALADNSTGPAARAALRQRFPVALIDEFQDTDPVQWQIFDAAFGGAGTDGSTLVLVGDPKQAIYAFRGADVHTYLDAVEGMDSAVLGTNWRSDPAVLGANEVLLTGATFGSGSIGFEPVRPAPANADRSMCDLAGDPAPALEVRLAVGDAVPRHSRSKHPDAVTKAASAQIQRDVARHVRDLLENTVIPDDDPRRGNRALRPEDICVLVAANHESAKVRDALLALGIPAVVNRGESVLESPAAEHWHRLLAGVARPQSAARARAAASSWFVGWDAEQIANASDEELAVLQERLRAWGEELDERGVAAFVGLVMTASGVATRVLSAPGGARDMTDLDHLGELLAGSCGHANTPSALLVAFEQLGHATNDAEPEADLSARRVESESSAVQIMTTHVSKGLEFPVVCCPSLWSSVVAVRDVVWWEDGQRHVDLAGGLQWGDPEEHQRRESLAYAELVGTSLRLLYVALTRARHHTALWWAPSEGAWQTGLARVLFGRDEHGSIDPAAFDTSLTEVLEPLDVEGSLQRLQPVVSRSGGNISLTVVGNSDDDTSRPWHDPSSAEPPPLEVATLHRDLPRWTNRWSFSKIVDSDARHGDPGDDSAGDTAGADELPPSPRAAAPRQPDASRGGADRTGRSDPVPLLLGGVPGGTGFGNLVHGVLERVDFCSGELEADLALLVSEQLRHDPWEVDVDLLVSGLAAMIRTPLGPLFDHRPLAELHRGDRLDEMSFEFNLAGSGPPVTADMIGRLALQHLDPDDPYRDWAESLAGIHGESRAAAARLAGHMTGSIDLVARITPAGGPSRFLVCDYKTNRLAHGGTDPDPSAFDPDSLPAAMAEHDYPLQALLYSVALHRYLRWRVPDYDPRAHLGGIGYLFVRGLVGPATPTVDGVPRGLAQWDPPAALITSLSDLLEGNRGEQR